MVNSVLLRKSFLSFITQHSLAYLILVNCKSSLLGFKLAGKISKANEILSSSFKRENRFKLC